MENVYWDINLPFISRNTQRQIANQEQDQVIDINLGEAKPPVGRYIYSVFHSVLALVAIYMAFRCNKKFDLGSFIVALCCPYIYIIYILATRGTCGILESQPVGLRLE